MSKVLLTGGSGFIAAHVLEILLQHGHSVITTVRSQEKIDGIKKAHAGVSSDKLDFRIVKDIAVEGAFDEAVKSIDGLDAVIHTASPFHFNVTDTKKDLLDPAIIGTTGILHAVKKYAPSVKRVVITSSFASIVDGSKGNWPEHTYSEKDWNPITEKEAVANPANGYRASKTFAEKAAWDFIKNEKPNFTLSAINPPLVLGPVVHYLNTLSNLNTSNQRIRNLFTGQNKEEISETGTFIWVDVRDLALAHVKAIEVPEAADKRFFITAGYFSNKEIAEIIRKNFPEFEKELPGKDVKGGDYPAGGVYKYDNSRTVEVLGIKFKSLEESIVDTVKSLKDIDA